MENKIEKLAKKDLKNISPYIPGKPIKELQRELGLKKIIKLASNENPLGPSLKVIEAIKKNLIEIYRYPEGPAFYLRNELSKFLKISPENIILGTGSLEVMDIFLQSFINPNEEIIIPKPSFIMYKIISYKIGAKPVEIPLEENFSYNLDKFLSKINKKTKVIILCNPNNPTGTIIYKKQLKKFLKEIPENIFILADEAYCEYVENKEFGSLFPYFKKKNILITRTFSKIYGLAGLRIGYGIAKEQIIKIMEKIKPPFNTTNLSQIAAIAALKDKNYFKKSYRNNCIGKKYLYKELQQLGIVCIPTEANFILCDFKKNTLPIIKKLEKNGIIIRNMESFGLPNNFVRISVGKKEENIELINNLKKIL